MNFPSPRLAIPALTAFAATAALAAFWLWRPEAGLHPRMPGTDLPPELQGAATVRNPVLAGKATQGAGEPASLPGAWPGFRGPNRDAISPETTPLARSWPAGGPRALWSVEAGEGYAGVAVLAGRVYLMDYARESHESVLRCFSLADGREIWRYAYPLSVKRNHGITRTVPAVTEKAVVAIDPKCNVLCVDAANGALRWGMNLVAEFGGNEGMLSQTFRLAGPRLTAAALAGCPVDTAETMKRGALSGLGGLLLDTEITDARNRLSSDELADAQDALCALLGSLKEPSRRLEGSEEVVGRGLDKNLVSDLSELIMELDDRALRTVVTAIEPELAAALIQTMTPVAHDRLFSSVPPSRSKRILDALEEAVPLGAVELTRSAQLFAQKVLAELVPRAKPLGKAVPLPARLREVLTAILSRE